MIAGDALVSDMQPAPASEPVVTIDPDGEVLLGLAALEVDVNGLDRLPRARTAVEKSAQEDLEARLFAVVSSAIGAEEDDCRLGHPELPRAEEGEPSRKPRDCQREGRDRNSDPLSHGFPCSCVTLGELTDFDFR